MEADTRLKGYYLQAAEALSQQLQNQTTPEQDYGYTDMSSDNLTSAMSPVNHPEMTYQQYMQSYGTAMPAGTNQQYQHGNLTSSYAAMNQPYHQSDFTSEHAEINQQSCLPVSQAVHAVHSTLPVLPYLFKDSSFPVVHAGLSNLPAAHEVHSEFPVSSAEVNSMPIALAVEQADTRVAHALGAESSVRSTYMASADKHKQAVRKVLQVHGFSEEELDRYEQLSKPGVPSKPAQVIYNLTAADLPMFSGELQDYMDFKSNFWSMISYFPEERWLSLLKGRLDHESKSIVASCMGTSKFAFSRAFELLEQQYYHPDILKHMYLQQVNTLVGTDCTQDDQRFEEVVAKIRRSYDHLMLISPISLLSLDIALTSWMKNMPEQLYDSLSELRYYHAEEFTFHRALKEAKDFVGLRKSQRLWGERRPKLGCSCSEKKNKVNSSEAGGVCAPEENLQEEDSKQNLSPIPSLHRDLQSASTIPSPQWMPVASGVQSKAEPGISGQEPQKGGYCKCNLCLSQEHFTTDCKELFTEEQLELTVQQREICLVCGATSHKAEVCHKARLDGSAALCSRADCNETPHTISGRFCSLCKKTSHQEQTHDKILTDT